MFVCLFACLLVCLLVCYTLVIRQMISSARHQISSFICSWLRTLRQVHGLSPFSLSSTLKYTHMHTHTHTHSHSLSHSPSLFLLFRLDPSCCLLVSFVFSVCLVSFVLSEDTQNDDGATVKGARIPIDVRLCDFDDVMYHVVLAAETINKLKVSISMPFFRDIQDKVRKRKYR